MTSSSSGPEFTATSVKGPLLVTAAIIRDRPNGRRFLIAKRKAAAANEAGKWEFPGGKVEAGENPESCLSREILEELGCHIQVGEIFGVASHVYYSKAAPRVESSVTNGLHVVLLCYDCLHVSGEPRALDAADVRWIEVDELDDFKWAVADLPFVEKLKTGTDDTRSQAGVARKG